MDVRNSFAEDLAETASIASSRWLAFIRLG
jgi:hypothetical protein